MTDRTTPFSAVPAKVSFPELEREVLDFWKQNKVFEASLAKNKGKGPEFIFYDGPPFPTGNPHHGTIFVSILKDAIPRYKTMRGCYVPRVWGWDSHGLPIETQAEKNLSITDKREIEDKIGVPAFNAECRRIVSEFNDSWRTYIDRIGRWVDMDSPYTTLDRDFMESVIWSFAESYRKGLVYKDYRVNPYCYRCQTPLSISDTRSDDSTRPRQDRAITVRFPIVGAERTSFLVWTTTPWTLPSNLAVAVGESIPYVFVKTADGETLILAKARMGDYKKELGKDATIVRELDGATLVSEGLRYKPLFPYFEDINSDQFSLMTADFVTTEDGTGLVHLAPGFGEVDYWACRQAGIEVQVPVDDRGVFTEVVTDFAGRNVHEANGDVIKHLKNQGVVFRDATIEHNYPHCWRCRTPLIYKALDAWYFSVEKVKDQLLKNNEQINWYPESVKDRRFGKWLENARDWNISRNRYWATPIPVWQCDGCDHEVVLSDGKEIEERAGGPVPDLHKEHLDAIAFSCDKCSNGTMRRVPEVLDGWWESGSMPYGQFHYPFENAEHFREHFPADFIVEYTGQIRCWFYYLHVLSTALFDKPAFKNCLTHGTLLAADGKKISKSQKNYTDPLELMDRFGADAVRAYLLSSAAVQMADLAFKDEGVDGMVKSISLPLWNALSFFTTYAAIDEIQVSDLAGDTSGLPLSELDRYILSEAELLVQNVEAELEQYSIHLACRRLPEYLDRLTNWYIRRSRSRVWDADKRSPDKLAFYSTLYRSLCRFTQVLAPFCPFLADAVWQRLGHADSVHLTDWPVVDQTLIDEQLSRDTELVRSIVSSGLAIRMREQIRVRQPLASARIATTLDVDLTPHTAVIQDELNVKSVTFLEDAGSIARIVGKPNAKLLGPKYGKEVQGIIKLAKNGELSVQADGSVTVGEYSLSGDEIELDYIGLNEMPVEAGTGFVVALDITVTPELELEGDARDLVRQIQELRKEADLNISDRIELSVKSAEDIINVYGDYVMHETLCVALSEDLANSVAQKEVVIGSRNVSLALKVSGQ